MPSMALQKTMHRINRKIREEGTSIGGGGLSSLLAAADLQVAADMAIVI